MAKKTNSVDLINKDVKNYAASGAGQDGFILVLSLVLIILAFLCLFLSGSPEAEEVPDCDQETLPALLQYRLEGGYCGKEVKRRDEKRAAVLAPGLHHRPEVELRQDLHHGNPVS